jgi:PAS domain S-box-containing protein
MIRDLKGRISSWNPTAEQYYGWPKEQAVGKIFTLVFMANSHTLNWMNPISSVIISI